MSGEHRSKSYHALLKSYPDSRKLNAVSEGAENLYLRLLAASDDRGRYWGEPTMVARKLYARRPSVTDAMVDDRLGELERGGLMRRYTADGETCLELVGLYRPLKSDRTAQVAFPAPAEYLDPQSAESGSKVDPPRIHSGSLVQGEGEGEGEVQGEGIGEQSPPAPSRKRSSFTRDSAIALLPQEHELHLGTAWRGWVEHLWQRKKPTESALQKHLAALSKIVLARGYAPAVKLLDEAVGANAQGLQGWAIENALAEPSRNGHTHNGRPTNGRRPHKSILDHMAEGTVTIGSRLT